MRCTPRCGSSSGASLPTTPPCRSSSPPAPDRERWLDRGPYGSVADLAGQGARAPRGADRRGAKTPPRTSTGEPYQAAGSRRRRPHGADPTPGATHHRWCPSGQRPRPEPSSTPSPTTGSTPCSTSSPSAGCAEARPSDCRGSTSTSSTGRSSSPARSCSSATAPRCPSRRLGARVWWRSIKGPWRCCVRTGRHRTWSGAPRVRLGERGPWCLRERTDPPCTQNSSPGTSRCWCGRLTSRRSGCTTFGMARQHWPLAGGADLKVVSQMLRHSSITITADTYISVLPEVARRAAAAAAAFVPRAARGAGP
jgi:hypothetical protein